MWLISFQSILPLCYHIHLVVYDTSKCHCEHKNGRESDNGIACKREGYFQHTLKCPSNQWCTGPYNTSGATEIQSLDEFCSKGKLSNIRYTFCKPILLHLLEISYDVCHLYIVILIKAKRSCGNGGLAPSCQMCYNKYSHTDTSNWCGGDCYFDEDLNICKDAGNGENLL